MSIPVRGSKASGMLRVAAVLAAFVAVASVAFAGPYQDAQKAYARGDYPTALRLAQQAVQENPNEPRAYVALGTVERKLGDAKAARDAWSNVFRLDPTLRSVNNKAGFLQAYQAVGGQPPVNPGGPMVPAGGSDTSSAVTGTQATAIIQALTQGNVYVAPDLKGEVDPAALDAAASATTKIVVLPTVFPYRSRDAMADDLRQRLNLGEGVVVVGTPKGVSASSGRLSHQQVSDALAKAGLDQVYAGGGLTAAIVRAAQATTGEVSDVRRGASNALAGILFGGLALIAGFVGFGAYKKTQALNVVREPLERSRQQVLENLTYVDGYLDLLPKGDDADRARALRQSAYEKYSTVTGLLQSPKSPDELRQAQPLMAQAMQELEECRRLIDKATGGTGVAMGVAPLPDQATDADRAARFRADLRQGGAALKPVEQVSSTQEAARLQQEIESIPADQRGVSFFSGQPLPASELVPVTITVNGQKRTVLASHAEADAIARGQTPPVRAFQQGSQYVPWYEYRGYDPYRDYYGGWGMGDGRGVLGTLVDFYVLSHLFGGGLFGGYGPWGWGGWGWGMPAPPVIVNNYPGYSGPIYDGAGNAGGFDFLGGGGAAAAPEPEHAGGFDFFGQQGYDDTAPDPGGGFDFGGGGADFGGGGDFGGGDFGGGDFGGGDFGS